MLKFIIVVVFVAVAIGITEYLLKHFPKLFLEDEDDVTRGMLYVVIFTISVFIIVLLEHFKI